jgi:endonuclease/exonuclease/phosphatase family metal-dependent hydrolase
MPVPRIVGLVAALALACGGGSSTASSDAAALDVAVRAAPSGFGPGRHVGRELTVMSRNLYLGADLDPVIAADSPEKFLAATTAVWAMVNKNSFHVRVNAIAEEIAAARPELVGLQEAYLWRIQSPGDKIAGGDTPATTVVFDHVQELVDALRDRSLHYRAVATVTLFDFEAPVLSGNPAAPFDDVRATDRGVVLAREDVQTENPEGHVYSTLLSIPLLGQQVPIPRGWVSVDVRDRGQSIRFVSTHLEAFHEGVRVAQAGELAAALAGETRPVVLVGDLNSQPGTQGEAVLASQGRFQDTWALLHRSAAGLTCCYLEDLTLPDTLETRIDYVLFRGPFTPTAMEIVGTAQQSGLWPSDHAGVVAELRLASRGVEHALDR